VRPGKVARATRSLGKPLDWNEATQGPCGDLPIRDQITRAGLEMVSEWVPDSEERRLIAAGAPVQIGIMGTVHPPLWVGVGTSVVAAADPAAPEVTNQPGVPWTATWIVDAPWAHPAWSQYLVLLYDLMAAPIDGSRWAAPVLYMDGATHEVIVVVQDPAARLDPAVPLSKQQIRRLTPANHGYQFAARNNEAAQARIQGVVDDIRAQRLSPDTDYRRVWDARFADGASLRRS
jgi:hypothetical protein